MKAQIKSVMPKPVERQDYYVFHVEVEIDGKSKTIPTPVNADTLLDFHALQAFVARHTGCLFKETGWTNVLDQVLRPPEPLPDRSGELEEIGQMEDEWAKECERDRNDRDD